MPHHRSTHMRHPGGAFEPGPILSWTGSIHLPFTASKSFAQKVLRHDRLRTGENDTTIGNLQLEHEDCGEFLLFCHKLVVLTWKI
jgi:hypothetical protein